VNLQSTDFELFGIPTQFAQTASQLQERWKALQAQAHPDNFAAQGSAAQRLAMQWSVRINEAYQRLKSPLKRAAYLCELNAQAIQAETNTAMPADFLMQQMAWREALDDAADLSNVEQLAEQVRHYTAQLLQDCERLLDVDRNYAAAAGVVRALMFVDRFGHDVSARLEQME
jgi:molecular chaperone HscB